MDYLAFTRAMSKRRQMVSFGSNDGLLHAVNMGFGVTWPKAAKNTPSNPSPLPWPRPASRAPSSGPSSPKESRPSRASSHDPERVHAYYVDLKPLILDLDLPGERRSALIGGPWMGGRPIAPSEGATGVLALDAFHSEIFALDVTDPEGESVFMWRVRSRGNWPPFSVQTAHQSLLAKLPRWPYLPRHLANVPDAPQPKSSPEAEWPERATWTKPASRVQGARPRDDTIYVLPPTRELERTHWAASPRPEPSPCHASPVDRGLPPPRERIPHPPQPALTSLNQPLPVPQPSSTP
jgi:hypothetical protein